MMSAHHDPYLPFLVGSQVGVGLALLGFGIAYQTPRRIFMGSLLLGMAVLVALA